MLPCLDPSMGSGGTEEVRSAACAAVILLTEPSPSPSSQGSFAFLRISRKIFGKSKYFLIKDVRINFDALMDSSNSAP